MLKMTKLGMVCEIMSTASMFLGIAQQYDDFHSLRELRDTSEYYKKFTALCDLCCGWGLTLEGVIDISPDNNKAYYIGITLRDNSPAPAFAPMAYHITGKPLFDWAMDSFEVYCADEGFSLDACYKEIRKIYHCK